MENDKTVDSPLSGYPPSGYQQVESNGGWLLNKGSSEISIIFSGNINLS